MLSCITTIFVISLASQIICDKINKPIFPPLPITVLSSKNDVCDEQSDLYLQNLENFTLWAHKMWDSTAKSPTGVLEGTTYHMGDFDQCLTVKAPFPTQYCLVTLKAIIPKSNVTKEEYSVYHDPYESIFEILYPTDSEFYLPRNALKLGWCVPASCSPQNLQNFLKSHLKNAEDFFLRNLTYSVEVSDAVCEMQNQELPIDVLDIGFCLLILFLILLVLSGTFYEYSSADKKQNSENCLGDVVQSFSLKTNFENLAKADTSDRALLVFYGTRSIYSIMVIISHALFFTIPSPLINFGHVETQYTFGYFNILMHGDLFIDSFFALGGILSTYHLLSHKEIYNPLTIIIFRYFRLMPVYAFVIFYYVSIFENLGSGPEWKSIIGQEAQDCREAWWTNILYISNYVKVDKLCIVQSWYLPCDFHFFIIATVICFLIKKGTKFGFTTLLVLILVAISTPFAVTVIYKLPGLTILSLRCLMQLETCPSFVLMYIKSHTRISPYLAGVVMGYVYYKLKGKSTRLSAMTSYLILLASTVIMVACLFGAPVFYDPNHKYNVWEAAIYAALSRPFFACGSLGWLFVASYGRVEIVHQFLSWRPWIPISKLSYIAYLVHFQFQLMRAGRLRNPQYFSFMTVISAGISDVVFSFFVALVLYLMIEAPLRGILKILVSKNNKDEIDKSLNVTVNSDVKLEEI